MIQADTPLTRHFIRKGEQISSDDLCYFSSETGEIINIKKESTPKNQFYFSHQLFDTSFDYKINKIISNYAIENIVQYQPIDESMIETLEERQRKEQEEEKEKQEHIREAKLEADKQIIEQKRQILEQKLQQNLANKNNEDNRESNQIDDNFINEIKNNIWL